MNKLFEASCLELLFGKEAFKNMVPKSYFITDKNGNCRHFSQDIHKQIGFKNHQLFEILRTNPAPPHLALLFHNQDLAKVMRKHQQSLKKIDKSSSFEASIIHKTQHYQSKSIRIISTYYANHNTVVTVWLIQSPFHDTISEELNKHSKFIHKIIENVPGKLYQFAIDPDGIWTWPYISPGATKLLGYTAKDIHEHPELAVTTVHPDDRQSLIEQVEISHKTLTTFSWVGRITKHGTNDERWIHAKSNPTKLADGTIAWDGTLTDISENKKLELKVQEQEALLKVVTQNMPGMAFQMRINLDIWAWHWIYVSEGVLTLLNITPEQLKENPNFINDFIHVDDLKIMRFNFQIAHTFKRPFTWSGRLRHESADVKWIHAQAMPTTQADGKVVWNGLFTDITLTKKLMHLENKLLRSEQEKSNAIQSSLEDNQFLSELLHELRTPLNAINGFTDLCLDGYAGRTTKKQQRYLNQIRTSGQHLLTLINRILDVSRNIQNDSESYQVSTHIQNFMQSFAKSMEPLLRQKNITLAIKTQTLPCYLMLDTLKVKQVLYNLVDNAIKYSPDHTQITIHLTWHQKILTLVIQDKGYGIPEHTKNELFASYVGTPQPKQTGQEKDDVSMKKTCTHDSTGLGLYLCRMLVVAMEGTIDIQSHHTEPGTKVRIVLPNIDEAHDTTLESDAQQHAHAS